MDKKGFTLIELLVTLVAGMFVFVATTYFLVGQQSGFLGQKRRVDLSGNIRIAMDFVTRSLRGAVVSAASGIPGGSVGNSSLTFRYMEDMGQATAATANTLTDASKGWTTNQWAGYQAVLTGGTGAGDVKTIGSNTGTQITVSSNWATTPDSTTTYKIVSERMLYRTGNNLCYRNNSVSAASEGIVAQNVSYFQITNDAAPPTRYDVTLSMTPSARLTDSSSTGAMTLQSAVAVRN